MPIKTPLSKNSVFAVSLSLGKEIFYLTEAVKLAEQQQYDVVTYFRQFWSFFLTFLGFRITFDTLKVPIKSPKCASAVTTKLTIKIRVYRHEPIHLQILVQAYDRICLVNI